MWSCSVSAAPAARSWVGRVRVVGAADVIDALDAWQKRSPWRTPSPGQLRSGSFGSRFGVSPGCRTQSPSRSGSIFALASKPSADQPTRLGVVPRSDTPKPGSAGLSDRLDKTQPVGDRGRLAASGDAELAEDVRDVDAGRVLADEQLVCDLSVRSTERDQAEDLTFAGSQPEARRLIELGRDLRLVDPVRDRVAPVRRAP